MNEETKEKVKYRILIWNIAITNACDNLHVACKLFDLSKKNDWIVYQDTTTDPPSNRSLEASISSYKALIEVAAIYVRQIFSTGNEGEKIAANNSAEINRIRDTILENTKIELGWQDEEFQNFYREIRDQRNRFLAHYDGNFANIQEIEQGITRMASPGLKLNREDVGKFIQFVSALRNAVVLELRNLS
ncbi:MAG: hypothetical protein R2805_13370 [Flavobacterium sp.]|uniref:hypothetical protein n=1 Tax=Flavobacterium sp. TaxID=239 RepID=UPI003528433A